MINQRRRFDGDLRAPLLPRLHGCGSSDVALPEVLVERALHQLMLTLDRARAVGDQRIAFHIFRGRPRQLEIENIAQLPHRNSLLFAVGGNLRGLVVERPHG